MEKEYDASDVYAELFGNVRNIFDISSMLDGMNEREDIDGMRTKYCDELLYTISSGCIEYGAFVKTSNPLITVFIENVGKLKTRHPYFDMIILFFCGEKEAFFKAFDKYAEEFYLDTQAYPERLDEKVLEYELIEPLKEAFPGFWSYAGQKIECVCKTDGTHKLCQLMADIYERKNDEAALDVLLEYTAEYPEMIIAQEYLGCIYFNLKMWNNAIATLESIKEPLLFSYNRFAYYVYLAEASGKIKDFSAKKKYLEKILDADADNEYAKIALTKIADKTSDQKPTRNVSMLSVKGERLSSEKLLEDELEAKINAGYTVFGKRLKMYRRFGKYGRQFRIDIGYLDLFCEDDFGNLYVIELKKDSGYDDAYSQLRRYLEWFDESKDFCGKKVYGIICLNSPSKELTDKVRTDSRISLFEYSILFREI